jgi:hypothetical protein
LLHLLLPPATLQVVRSIGGQVVSADLEEA